jgi:hypothetical protein
MVTVDGKVLYHPIGFKSHKFSGAACRWDTHKKEAYALFWGVQSFCYFLLGKEFVAETDHKNLLYIEKSESALVIRWRIYLQGFMFMLKHIPGKTNHIADWGTRMFTMMRALAPDTTVEVTADSQLVTTDNKDPSFYLKQVHGGRMLHKGARETWKQLNQYFPGHHIPFAKVQEWVADCPRCQKDRLKMTADIQPVIRTVIPPTFRSRLGVDILKITPPDADGYTDLVVSVDLKTKHVGLYPIKTESALEVARALFEHMCTFGLYDEIISDPGSNLMSDVVAQLNLWLGVRHVISLVDVHESNGVERTNGEIVRHLRSITNDTRIKKHWSKPEMVSIIKFALNDRKHTEAPYSAFELMFGTEVAKYFRLPEALDSESVTNAWLKELNDNLKIIRDITRSFQAELIAERKADNSAPAKQNQFQSGDLVLYDSLYDSSKRRSEKLQSRFKGPYLVKQQILDEVEAQHICMGYHKRLLVERVKLFTGTREEAERLAMEDADQFLIKRIIAFKGNPAKRLTMEFEVEFDDGDIVWKQWDANLATTQQYVDYCDSLKELHFLTYSTASVGPAIAALNKTQITEVTPGDIVYIPLRAFGYLEYDELTLPDKEHLLYVVPAVYTRWAGTTHLRIDIRIELFSSTYMWNHQKVFQFGYQKEQSEHMIIVNDLMLIAYPDIMVLIVEKAAKKRVEARLHQSRRVSAMSLTIPEGGVVSQHASL